MNEDRIKGQWKQLNGKLKARWGKLTDDDLQVVDGNGVEPVKIDEPKNHCNGNLADHAHIQYAPIAYAQRWKKADLSDGFARCKWFVTHLSRTRPGSGCDPL